MPNGPDYSVGHEDEAFRGSDVFLLLLGSTPLLFLHTHSISVVKMVLLQC